ncbi:MAG: endonuclease III [Planctomycetota bacterium]|nr:endonuclease III [Planctomycetota bacterium]
MAGDKRTTKRATRARVSVDALLNVHARLRRTYGPRSWRVDREPILDSLIGTILSQSTSDVNSNRAFGQLKTAFPDWDAARLAPAAAIEAAIRSGGLAKTKARRIKDILQRVHAARGDTSLEHLRRAPTERIKKELGELPGVGPKTIACVLMFNLKRPDFPVDTHIHRISRRLGWVPPKASAEETYQVLNAVVPERLTYELHVLLITHGRRLCRSQNPQCIDCPLWLSCAYARKLRATLAKGPRRME